jgi:hypothetical protein
LYYVPRLGSPAGRRPETPLATDRYRAWVECQGRSDRFGCLCGACVFAALACGLWAGRALRYTRPAAERQATELIKGSMEKDRMHGPAQPDKSMGVKQITNSLSRPAKKGE